MSRTMRAFRHLQAGKMGQVVEVPIPEPGPGQIRLKTAGSGLCHSDLLMMHSNPPFGPLPCTLGHEAAGWIDALGPGVSGYQIGDAYGMYLMWGCGHCQPCARGEENICRHGVATTFTVGWDGGHAEYFLADTPRHLVPLKNLDPIAAAPMMCAGITTQHAISKAAPTLHAGSTAVIVGIGGLGHLAIQILKASTPARVIAVDVHAEKLAHGRKLGADEGVLAGPDAAAEIRNLTQGVGADLVLDLVGNSKTLELSSTILAPAGRLEWIGVGGGTLSLQSFGIARDASISMTFAGTITDLIEVVELSRRGLVKADISRIGFNDMLDAYAEMDAGRLQGRAVLVP